MQDSATAAFPCRGCLARPLGLVSENFISVLDDRIKPHFNWYLPLHSQLGSLKSEILEARFPNHHMQQAPYSQSLSLQLTLPIHIMYKILKVYVNTENLLSKVTPGSLGV